MRQRPQPVGEALGVDDDRQVLELLGDAVLLASAHPDPRPAA